MMQRTTFQAEADDLTALRDEARRRHTSVAQLIREIVAAKAAALRSARIPHVGIGSSGQGVSGASTEDEASPAATPYN